MSSQNEIEVVDGDRSVESWIIVLFASLVTLVVAVMLPAEWRLPLFIGGGLLCAVGVALLVKQEARR